jgi:hypothetical protein
LLPWWLQHLLHPVEGTARPAEHDPSILLCEFRGFIGDGGCGNKDVDLMGRTIKEALSAGVYRAIVLDLSEVRYTFGNHIVSYLWELHERGVKVILVIPPDSKELRVPVDFLSGRFGWNVCDSRASAYEKLAAESP